MVSILLIKIAMFFEKSIFSDTFHDIQTKILEICEFIKNNRHIMVSLQEKLVKFILACQDDETGGFADRPGDIVSPVTLEILHTI